MDFLHPAGLLFRRERGSALVRLYRFVIASSFAKRSPQAKLNTDLNVFPISSAGVFTLFTLFTLFFNSAKTRIDCKNYLVVKVQHFRTGLALNNSTFVLLLKASQQFLQTDAPISSRYNYPCW